MTTLDYSDLTKKKPEKTLLAPAKKNAGRNNHGSITIRHQGGGHKRRYRLVDFKRTKRDMFAKVAAIEYDPNRSAHIALLHYEDGVKAYIICPKGLTVGDKVIAGENIDIKPGYSLPLSNMPVGTVIHNIELRPGKGGQIARSAGCSATLVAKEGKYCQVKMTSGELRYILSACYASVGEVGNSDHENVSIGKAGRSRWKGIRPSVRGMSMNPVDHPMGGGEGKGKGTHPRTPWGKPCKGYRTRNNKKTQAFIIKRRKK